MKGTVRRGAIPALIAIALSLVACGQQGEKAPETGVLDTFVGQAEGSSAYVALITDGESLSGFVTNGKLFGKWFATAELDDGQAQLTARDGAELGDVTIDGDSASGEVLVGLGTEPFEAGLASGDASLFTAAEKKGEDSFEAGWIVLPDGSERGTYDTFIGGEFTTHPAPKLRSTVDIPGFGAQAPHAQPTLFLEANTQAP